MREAETDASPQAQDIAIEHAAPPLPVEGRNPDSGDLRPLQGKASGAHGLPHVWYVREATGSRRLIVDEVGVALSRVIGETVLDIRSDTPLDRLGIGPDTWVCVAWALADSYILSDADIPGMRTVQDVRRVIGARA